MIIELRRGDKIIACNETVTVGDILFQHIDTGSDYTKAFADVEFRDSKGNYRHYQSWNDGGKIQLKNGKEFEFEVEQSNWDYK